MNDSFLFAGLRALLQSLLVMALPATVALLIVVPLALSTKSAFVDVHVVAHRVSFTLLEGWHSGQDVELLHSIPVKRVRLSVDSLEISPKELIDEERSGTAIDSQTIQFRPRQDAHSDYWVEFKTKADSALVSEIRLTAGSQVEIYRQDDTLGLGILPKPKDRVSGDISLNGPASVIVNDCQIFDGEGRRISGFENDQQHLALTSAVDPVHFNSEGKVDLELDVSVKEEEFLGAFSPFLRVRELVFPPGDRENPLPIDEGSVIFRDIQKAPIDLKSSFLEIPGDDVMEIATIGGKSGALDLRVFGTVRSLKTGAAPEPDNEELPSLLDWLYHNQRLGVIVGVLVWVSGTVLGAVKLVGELKKSGRS
jgi:hypothetical protein